MTVKDLSMAAWPFWLKRLTVFLTQALEPCLPKFGYGCCLSEHRGRGQAHFVPMSAFQQLLQRPRSEHQAVCEEAKPLRGLLAEVPPEFRPLGCEALLELSPPDLFQASSQLEALSSLCPSAARHKTFCRSFCTDLSAQDWHRGPRAGRP